MSRVRFLLVIAGLAMASFQLLMSAEDGNESRPRFDDPSKFIVRITSPNHGAYFCTDEKVTATAELWYQTDDCTYGPDDGVPQGDDGDYTWYAETGGTFDGGDNTGATVQYVTPEDADTVKLTVTYDRDGSEGDVSDDVTINVVKVELIFTDITGLHGIGKTDASKVPRIPLTEQPDGIACDGTDGVDDGARMLVRAVISDSVDESILSEFTVDWGYEDGTGAFAELPTISKREGSFAGLSTDEETALTDLDVGLPGESYERGGERTVFAAQVYTPPIEFDRTTPYSTKKERNLRLAGTVKRLEADFCDVRRDLALVRPPLVLVHGVNSGPNDWGTKDSDEKNRFAVQFDTGDGNWGFHCVDFRVDHSGVDKELDSEGETLGFGEISHIYKTVPEMIDGKNNPNSAKQKFRNGGYFSGKKIAVQKVDIVAHSYGGLLSRWYIERAGDPAGSEYANRRDVRKLITIGTPHRGSPLANLVCEIFRNTLIANAQSEGVGALEVKLGRLLSGLDKKGFGSPLTGNAGLGQLPNALTKQRSRPRHAYEVFTVASERLSELNDDPFHDDVGYAAIAGTNHWIPLQFGLSGRPFKMLQAKWNPLIGGSAKYYFAWLWLFNKGGTTDGIVPVWSAQLGVASHNASIHVNHLTMQKNKEVNIQVRTWLNLPIPSGVAQRAAFDPAVPVSERNAYVGSKVNDQGISRGGGVNPNAIVRIHIDKPEVHPAIDILTPGPRDVWFTGMMKSSQIGAEKFKIVTDEIIDNTLQNLGALSMPELIIDRDQLAGAQPDDYVAFKVTSGRIARRHETRVCGQDGSSGKNTTHLVVYEMSALPDKQSPPSEVETPEFKLPPVGVKPDEGNKFIIRVLGAVEAKDLAEQEQTIHLQLWDSDGLAPDDKLVDWEIVLKHPAGIWEGMLIQYDTTVTLRIDDEGNVRGDQGSSDESRAQVYQKLICPGLPSNPISDTAEVPGI